MPRVIQNAWSRFGKLWLGPVVFMFCNYACLVVWYCSSRFRNQYYWLTRLLQSCASRTDYLWITVVQSDKLHLNTYCKCVLTEPGLHTIWHRHILEELQANGQVWFSLRGWVVYCQQQSCTSRNHNEKHLACTDSVQPVYAVMPIFVNSLIEISRAASTWTENKTASFWQEMMSQYPEVHEHSLITWEGSRANNSQANSVREQGSSRYRAG